MSAPRSPIKYLRQLVVDEVSMVRADLMGAVELFLRLHGPMPGTPFGGVRIVLVGDVFQLPPVVDDGLISYFERNKTGKGYNSPWWWESSAVSSVDWKVWELKRCYRQLPGEQRFVELLQRLRINRLTPEDWDLLDTRVANAGEDVLRLTATNAAADSWNKYRLEAASGIATRYVARVIGDPMELQRARWPVPDHLFLKDGARVVFVQNDRENKRWVNGDMGTVVSRKPTHVSVRLDREPFPVYEVAPVTWKLNGWRFDEGLEDWVEYTKAEFTQIPLNLGWARTINKAQGQSYRQAHVNLGKGAFAPGQTYVALSRVRSLDGLSFERRITPDDVFCDPDAQAWMQRMQLKIP